MSILNENVSKLLNEAKTWTIATIGETPNAVPILFKKVRTDESLVLFDVFMQKTLDNIVKNNNVAVTVYNESTLEGYQIKGTAEYSTAKDLVDEGNAATSAFKLTTKGAVIVKIKQVIVLTPGPDIGKVLFSK
ncbi:pyridoxamine 5'-phosphate oxidase family protein [Dehalobacter restrictus]|uniref:Pyridoxamine 5'-phosphate oxidase family protein n=1 Tax=Dehalobacter restrictus TaxID=55583 RepID=A0A857DDD0_9FIRM|nr:pyridoxamine 5'-phosphate oxidase family protein [Dehalobacter restrictus]QGZ99229.1 pyridoxamine 5'-phosphate oxidase family protein [Dehalobacter restrictus]